ncbi:centromere protein Q [Latimeria chalumnae]|uniref:centromere protein Q n=1 Tax=Latimeria chalumnae TaxID=7897 RepID=UPI00313E6431
MEEESWNVQERIRTLQSNLEQRERESAKVLRRTDGGFLQLPALPKLSLESPTLQEELLQIPNQAAILKDLCAIQDSSAMQGLLRRLEKAHEEADSFLSV